MSSPFAHDVLGDGQRAERWLKIFPRNVFIKLLLFIIAAFIQIMYLGTSGWFFIISGIATAIYGIVWAILSIVEKSTDDYQRGGGLTKMEIIKRKRRHKKTRAVYALGVEKISSKGGR